MRETFDESSAEWDLYRSDKSIARIENKSLEIESLNDHGTSRYIPIFKPDNPFSIETEIDYSALTPKNKAGVIFAFKDWDNFAYFLLNNNSETYIGYVKDGNLNEKISGMSCSSFKPKEINLIKIYREGEKLVFSVNGEIQFAVPSIGMYGLNLGYAIFGKGKLRVNDLVYKYYTNSSSKSLSEEDKEIKATGTGFLISDKGYVVTNEHVISKSNQIYVENNGKTYKAELVTVDKANDIAILKISDTAFKVKSEMILNIRDNFNANLGAYVYTVGYPLALEGMGKEPKFADGKISAKTGFEGAVNSFQTTIPVQPGNSGSPVFNEQGEVIGIINAKYRGGDNVSYAVKSTFIKNLIDALPNDIPLNRNNSLQHLNLEDKLKIQINYIYLIKIK
ncbi:MAG: hypothetical protein Fur0023_13270 [Bacteroidia bacterium]